MSDEQDVPAEAPTYDAPTVPQASGVSALTDVLARLLDAIELAVIATDLDGTVTYWSKGAEALYGWSARECIGLPVVGITPALESREVAEQIMADIKSGTGWHGVFPVRRKDGSVFDGRVTLSPMWDDVGALVGVIGVSEDVTADRQQERDLADRTQRLELALESGRMGTWSWDIASQQVSWDESLELIYGLEPGTFDGNYETYIALIHPDDRALTTASVQRALATGADHEVEHRLAGPAGSSRWIAGAGRVVRAADGTPKGMIGVAADITARKTAERERAALLAAEQRAHASAEQAGERLAFLSAAGEALAATLDYDQTLQQVAEVVVARFADWCTVDLVDDELGTVRRVAVAHSAATGDGLAGELLAMHPRDRHAPWGVPLVIRTGEPALYTEITDAMLQAAATDARHLELLRALGITSMAIVPLEARGRTMGALSVVSSRQDRHYGAEDLTLATELARRAAVAIDNARMFAERAAVAAALQRSLLPPELPHAAGLEVAARYRPGRRGLEIGGDFYDMFPLATGVWCLVMGDVCGKGAEAAALTGAVRWTVRAVATGERDPRRIIKVLNDTLLLTEQSHNRFCTIVVAIATVADGAVRLSVASGGHPPPLVRRADGTVQCGPEGGTLVGAFPHIDVAFEELELRPGDAIVLYTDGVTEARAGAELYGEARLAEVVARLGGGTAAATAQAIEAAVTTYQTGQVRDDLALLVVRVPASGTATAIATQAVALPSQ